MIKTLIGIIILLLPFLYVLRFENKTKGFLYMLTFFIAFHLTTSLFLQFFGIFNYITVTIINIIVCIGFLLDFFTIHVNRVRINFNYKSIVIILFILIIVTTQFWSVHYNYTGVATTTDNFYEKVENVEYPYPYFSDEWCAVAFIDYSINSGKLPAVNPLWHNKPFANIEMGFHSFLSNFFIILDLEPLNTYSLFSIVVSTTLCILSYIYLRINDKNIFISAIACLSVPHIISSGNLSTIWVLIPVTIGVLCVLLYLIFISMKKPKAVFVSAILSLIFYPPLIVIIGPVSLLYYYHFIREHIKKLSIIAGLVAMGLLLFYLFNNSAFNYILSKLFYPSFYGSFIPQLSLWLILPIPISILAFVGIFRVFREKQIEMLVALSVVLIFWALYASVTWRLIIGNERAVFMSAILLTIASGFGMQYFYDKSRKHVSKKVLNTALIIILVSFLFLVPTYTQGNNWRKLVVLHPTSEYYFRPSSPVNLLITEDDLELFDNITNANFLSSNDWKGLVIGSATNNYPLESKDSVITNSILRYSEFYKSCSKMNNLTKEYDIDYLYTTDSINCTGWNLLGTSDEGFNLYRWSNE